MNECKKCGSVSMGIEIKKGQFMLRCAKCNTWQKNVPVHKIAEHGFVYLDPEKAYKELRKMLEDPTRGSENKSFLENELDEVSMMLDRHYGKKDESKVGLVKDIAISLIGEERRKQTQKWGYQLHTPYEWLPILMEEVGEMAKEMWVNNRNGGTTSKRYKDELIQVAAVAQAMLENVLEMEQSPYIGEKIKFE